MPTSKTIALPHNRLVSVATATVTMATWLLVFPSVEASAQSTVRENNIARSTPGFLSQPLSTLAGRNNATGANNVAATDSLDEAYFEQYEKQLNAILKTRRDEEKAFIKSVVEQIKAEKLSTRLVNTSFKWVRNKRPNVKNSFVYFERVLRILANRQGVEDAVPPFDPAIYNVRPATTLRGGNS